MALPAVLPRAEPSLPGSYHRRLPGSPGIRLASQPAFTCIRLNFASFGANFLSEELTESPDRDVDDVEPQEYQDEDDEMAEMEAELQQLHDVELYENVKPLEDAAGTMADNTNKLSKMTASAARTSAADTGGIAGLQAPPLDNPQKMPVPSMDRMKVDQLVRGNSTTTVTAAANIDYPPERQATLGFQTEDLKDEATGTLPKKPPSSSAASCIQGRQQCDKVCKDCNKFRHRDQQHRAKWCRPDGLPSSQHIGDTDDGTHGC